jgi:PAS domain S-box-containing protein
MSTDFGTLILNETPDAVIVTTPQGAVVCWTPGAQAVFGYTEQEAKGRLLSELIMPDPGADANPAPALACGSGVRSYESLRRAKNGALIYIDASSKAVRDGDAEFVLWSKKDVTHLKVQREARLFEARFHTFLEMTPDATIVSDAAGRIVLANARTEQLFGFAPGALRGVALLALLPQAACGEHARSCQCGQGQQRAAVAARRRDGSEFAADVSSSTIATQEGALTVSAIRSCGQVGEHAAGAMHELRAELAGANAAKERFLEAMSHELRTPLNAILGFSGTLLMKLPGPLNADQEHQLKTIQGSARHLLALIDSLLDLTMLESGTLELYPQPLVCQELIEELGAAFRPLVRQKGLQLVLDCPAAPLAISVDHRALRQILIHILGNAIKFTESGTVRLTLARREVGGRPWLAFCVSDTGVGIEPDGQARLFEAFSQFDAGPKRRSGGAGLGLHVSKKLAELLHGRIEFDSRHGSGSTFTLALPASIAA